MREFTVSAQARNPLGQINTSDDAVEDVYDRLLLDSNLHGAAVSADVVRHRLWVTATVTATDENQANEIVTKALGEALVAAGILDGYQINGSTFGSISAHA